MRARRAGAEMQVAMRMFMRRAALMRVIVVMFVRMVVFVCVRRAVIMAVRMFVVVLMVMFMRMAVVASAMLMIVRMHVSMGMGVMSTLDPGFALAAAANCTHDIPRL